MNEAIEPGRSHRAQGALSIIKGATVRELLAGQGKAVMDVVRQAYLAHGDRRTLNPASVFLRPGQPPNCRIIGLPAAIMAEDSMPQAIGIKWIASYPDNVQAGMARASATIVLNDPRTGVPLALLEGAAISAARTGASAAVAATALAQGAIRERRLGVIGAGPIAATTLGMLAAAGWSFSHVRVHDLLRERAQAFCEVQVRTVPAAYSVCGDAREVIAQSDLVLLATTAAQPHLFGADLFRAEQLVLHLSLRDLGTDVVHSSFNLVDDVDHCLTANTSLHLAEQECGNRLFVNGTLDQLLRGELEIDPGRPKVFSPFGMGILDIAVAHWLYERAWRQRLDLRIDDFIG